MPLYIVHLYPWNGSSRDNSTKKSFHKSLYEQIIALHSKTFSCDPATVRVECVNPCFEGTTADYGGYGYQSSTGTFSVKKSSDYIVIQMDFSGSGEQWQAYCRNLVRLPGFKGRDLRSIFLQRNQFEFEIRDVKIPGVVLGLDGEELPTYEK